MSDVIADIQRIWGVVCNADICSCVKYEWAIKINNKLNENPII